MRMKQCKDPFEAAFEEQEEEPSPPPGSPKNALNRTDELPSQIHPPSATAVVRGGQSTGLPPRRPPPAAAGRTTKAREDDDDDDEEEDNMEVELSKFSSSTGDPDKMAKMQTILSQFTDEQMSRYESFRRSGFQKANMKKLLTSLTGRSKVPIPMTIVVSGIAKMFVGELVETARIVMTERKDNGPIRPCHIREAYRRLKLEGKVPKRSVPKLFR